MNVLVIGAHPDDEILGCGGTMARHVENGDNVFVAILAWGVASRYTPDMIEIQKSRVMQASNIIGVKETVFFGIGGSERRFDEFPFIDVIRPLEDCIDRFRPDIIYTHHRGDSNTDHQITFKATVSAARTLRKFVVKKFLCYETLSSTDQAPPFLEYAFMPNVFVNIEPYLERKIEAMSCYKSELHPYPHPRSLESIRFQAKVWGHKSACEAAEAFILVREILP